MCAAYTHTRVLKIEIMRSNKLRLDDKIIMTIISIVMWRCVDLKIQEKMKRMHNRDAYVDIWVQGRFLGSIHRDTTPFCVPRKLTIARQIHVILSKWLYWQSDNVLINSSSSFWFYIINPYFAIRCWWSYLLNGLCSQIFAPPKDIRKRLGDISQRERKKSLRIW